AERVSESPYLHFFRQKRLFQYNSRLLGGQQRGALLGQAAIAIPQIARDSRGVATHALAGKVVADTVDVAPQNEVALAVCADVRHLWKVNQYPLALPVQDVIGR